MPFTEQPPPPDLPPYPPVPYGYARWVYVGPGIRGRTCLASEYSAAWKPRAGINWLCPGVGNWSGSNPRTLYIVATRLPEGCSALPGLPPGFSHWECVGRGTYSYAGLGLLRELCCFWDLRLRCFDGVVNGEWTGTDPNGLYFRAVPVTGDTWRRPGSPAPVTSNRPPAGIRRAVVIPLPLP